MTGYTRRREPYPGYRLILAPCGEGRHGDCGGASNSWYLDAEWRRRHDVPATDVPEHVRACQCDCHGSAPVDLGLGIQSRLAAWGIA